MRITSVLMLLAMLIPVLASCGQNTEPYTTGDAQALLDAGVFDGDMVKVESFPSVLYGGGTMRMWPTASASEPQIQRQAMTR